MPMEIYVQEFINRLLNSFYVERLISYFQGDSHIHLHVCVDCLPKLPTDASTGCDSSIMRHALGNGERLRLDISR
jgi:hypothetical protein